MYHARKKKLATVVTAGCDRCHQKPSTEPGRTLALLLLCCQECQLANAGRIAPRQLPSPMRRNPSRSQNPRRITSSPSCRNFLCSPVGNVIGSLPREVSSNRHPRALLSAPDTVP